MEIDTLKDLWQKDKNNPIPEVSLEKQKEIHSPLAKIRKNMKMEFWSTLISWVMIFSPVIIFKMGNEKETYFLYSLLGIGVCITLYYFRKFYSLYKKINTQHFTTYHHLLNLRYELVLNAELYKSYYVSFLPFGVIFLIKTKGLENNPLIMVCAIGLFAVFMYYFGKFWLKELYGKHIITISDLVDSMSDEKSDFQFNRNSLSGIKPNSWIGRLSQYFTQKLGNVLGTICLILLAFIILMMISFIAGIIIGYVSIYLENN